MRAGLALVLLGALGCSKAGPTDKPPITTTPDPITQTPEVKPPPATPGAIAIQMTAATLADDCGTGPRTPPPPKPAKPITATRSEQESSRKNDPPPPAESRQRGFARGDVACQQSSIQLSIVAPGDAKPGDLSVKSVELVDGGAAASTMAARAPSVWSAANGAYEPWDQKIAPGQELSVSYALARPDWSKVKDRYNKAFVVRAVLSINGADQTVQQTVEIAAPTSLPPNVRT
jgi:hypothetical protein